MKKLFIFFLMVFSCSSQAKKDVKVGQVWVYMNENPFNKFTHYYLIIDTKNGYAEYLSKYNDSDCVYTESADKNLFLLFDNYVLLGKATHNDSVMFNLIPKVCEEHTQKGIDSSCVNTLQIKFNTLPNTVLARYTEGDNLLWIRLYNGSEMTLKREKAGFRIIKLKSKNGDSLGIK